jgi:orotate phosphoribosyltransferase
MRADTQTLALQIFERSGALLEGHFTYTSGRHGRHYLEKFRVLEDPARTVELCRMIAEHFANTGIQTVAGPTVGGVILAYEVARQMGVRGIFAERDAGGQRALRRGFSLARDERVLIVEDIVTTGGSVREMLDCVRAGGGEVAGVGLLADRTGGEQDFGVPTFACLTLALESWAPGDCPLCTAGVPLEGKRGSSAAG